MIELKKYPLDEKIKEELMRELDRKELLQQRKKSYRHKKNIQMTYEKNIFFPLLTNYFRPSLYLPKIYDLNLNLLKEWNIKLVICDLDNTLVPHYIRTPTKESIQFVKNIINMNIEFLIVSNNTQKRVSEFARKLNVEYLAAAKKPFTKKIKKYIEDKKLSSSEVVFIGDQIVTDILLANILNIESILVSPMLMSEYNFKRFQVWIEKILFRRLEKQNLLLQFDNYSFGENEYEIL